MKEFGEGSRDIIISTTGWDINPRALGIVPARREDRDPQGLPLGLGRVLHDACRRACPTTSWRSLLDMMAFLLKPEQQAFSYDEGYLYPGPAVKNVPLSHGAARRARTSSGNSAVPNMRT